MFQPHETFRMIQYHQIIHFSDKLLIFAKNYTQINIIEPNEYKIVCISFILYKFNVINHRAKYLRNYLVIIVLSLWGYIQQIILINKRKDIGSFSILVPGIMIICSILKIFFWFISPYSELLLLQAFLLITFHVTSILLSLFY